MFIPLNCIALRTVRYNDRHSILTVYTRQAGRLSLLVPAGSGKSGARYRALTMPLAVFECMADIKPGREIHNFKDLKPDALCLQGDYSHPVKSVLAFFLADFFYSVLKEPLGEAPMFELIRHTSGLLWNLPAHSLANLHLLTMLRTAGLLGITPDVESWQSGRRLDLEEGRWIADTLPLQYKNVLDTNHSDVARRLMDMTPANFHLFRFNRAQRNLTVDYMLRYFMLHGFDRLNIASLDVIKELF